MEHRYAKVLPDFYNRWAIWRQATEATHLFACVLSRRSKGAPCLHGPRSVGLVRWSSLERNCSGCLLCLLALEHELDVLAIVLLARNWDIRRSNAIRLNIVVTRMGELLKID